MAESRVLIDGVQGATGVLSSGADAASVGTSGGEIVVTSDGDASGLLCNGQEACRAGATGTMIKATGKTGNGIEVSGFIYATAVVTNARIEAPTYALSIPGNSGEGSAVNSYLRGGSAAISVTEVLGTCGGAGLPCPVTATMYVADSFLLGMESVVATNNKVTLTGAILGGSIILKNSTVTCSGVYDKNYVHYTNTCPVQ